MVTLSKRYGFKRCSNIDYSFVFSERVRAISIAMGLRPVIWTRLSPTVTFDTGGTYSYYFSKFAHQLKWASIDYNIAGNTTSSFQVIQNWENILATLPL